MHDGPPLGGGTTPDWSTFLAGLGYTGPNVLRTLGNGSPGLPANLGLALYVVDPPSTGAAPEPMSVIVWGFLMGIGLVSYRCQTKRS